MYFNLSDKIKDGTYKDIGKNTGVLGKQFVDWPAEVEGGKIKGIMSGSYIRLLK